MLKLKNLVATLCVTFIVCFAGNILAQPGELDSVEAHSLEFLLLLSETKSMEYQNGSERFDAPLFTDFAGHEQRHMETLENLAQQYIVEIDRGWWGCFVLFWGVDELDFMCDPFATDQTWRTE